MLPGRPGLAQTHLDATEFQSVNLIVEVLNGAKHIIADSNFMSEDQKNFPLRLKNKPSLENQTYLKYYLQQWFTGTFSKTMSFSVKNLRKKILENKVSKKVSVSGLIDFYFAGTDVLCYDLAVTLNDWAISKTTKLLELQKNYFDKW